MHTRHLIDAIVQHTTVFIAQLSTAAGLRAPLAHVVDRVFFDLAREIERQGVRQKVAADMFGLALRSYQKKMQRLTESASERNRTVWEAVVDFISREGRVTRGRVMKRFERDNDMDIAAVLKDLVESGLVYSTGRGDAAVYGMATALDRQAFLEQQDLDTVTDFVWLSVHQRGPLSEKGLREQLPYDKALISRALEALIADGRIDRQDGDGEAKYSASTFVVPVGASSGWEAAVLDHFRAVVKAIAAKLNGGTGKPRSESGDIIGGATLCFDISDGHPLANEVLGLLERIRNDVDALWTRVEEHNEKHPIANGDLKKVWFYFGQNVEGGQAPDEKGALG